MIIDDSHTVEGNKIVAKLNKCFKKENILVFSGFKAGVGHAVETTICLKA